jgi:hypothetical protein
VGVVWDVGNRTEKAKHNSCRGRTGKIFQRVQLQGDVRWREEGDCGKFRAFAMARDLSQHLSQGCRV